MLKTDFKSFNHLLSLKKGFILIFQKLFMKNKKNLNLFKIKPHKNIFTFIDTSIKKQIFKLYSDKR